MEGRVGRVRDYTHGVGDWGHEHLWDRNLLLFIFLLWGPCGLYNPTNLAQRHLVIFCVKHEQDHAHNQIKTKKQLLNNNLKSNKALSVSIATDAHTRPELSGISHMYQVNQESDFSALEM